MPEGTLSAATNVSANSATLTLSQTNNFSSCCTYCRLPIKDQYIYKASNDIQWHEKCLKCVECDKILEENSKCYIKNNKAYCRDDYLRLFSFKCFRCGLILKPDDMIMKCKTLVYHIGCFHCDICNKKFQPGDEFLLKENNTLICKEDSINNELSRNTSTPATALTVNINYRSLLNSNSDDSSYSPSISSSSVESSLNLNTVLNNQNKSNLTNNGKYEILESSSSIINYNHYSNIDQNSNDYNYTSLAGDMNSDDDDDGDDTCSERDLEMMNYNNNNKRNNFSASSSSSKTMNSHSKPARIRTVLNEKQLHTLRACYGANPRPDALMKEQLVEMTGLSPRVIRVWFQNKRCKDKKKTLMVRQGESNPQHQHSQHVIFERCF